MNVNKEINKRVHKGVTVDTTQSLSYKKQHIYSNTTHRHVTNSPDTELVVVDVVVVAAVVVVVSAKETTRLRNTVRFVTRRAKLFSLI